MATKRTDLSVFKNHGTGIPVKIRDFFEIGGFQAGDQEIVKLVFDGREYTGKLERIRSTAKQTRLMWPTELSAAFLTRYPEVLQTKQYPDLNFYKTGSREYDLEFTGIAIESGQFDFEDSSMETEVTIQSDIEGEVKRYYTTRYERSPNNRRAAIAIHGLKCMACGFSFEDAYGELGKNFIEVHHVVPLSSKKEKTAVNPETDLICLCSNCHKMVHRKKGEIITLEELTEIIAMTQEQQIKESKSTKDTPIQSKTTKIGTKSNEN